ncbi:acid-activated periplasmic chaperone HdeB [Klebsiella pneumoniae]|nr:acid-activated periplasmic chaperone HdeB [Klebsiella pneumoniae]PLL68754.1 acid-resistance protein [Klebsiella pneumoniae]HBR2775438.1 acid-activated periplasmic chaperone HdeB [Klebsiella pneumoniae]HBV3516891.1 acid-activated periplasmic chaperone HdeB [Klebsiella pneumoniae]HBW3326563.1 acid-activated periplasmic chaperone HdeB [Klebsiella pneumoniae]
MNLPKALVLTVAATTFCLMTSPAFAVEETTPQNMTCQEFMDMNPKSMTPVAFWVVNRNTDFSGGDYVDWHEVETVSVPKMLQECHKNPAAKLGDLSAVIKKYPPPPASGRGNPPRCGGSRFTHRYRIRTADGGR